MESVNQRFSFLHYDNVTPIYKYYWIIKLVPLLTIVDCQFTFPVGALVSFVMLRFILISTRLLRNQCAIELIFPFSIVMVVNMARRIQMDKILSQPVWGKLRLRHIHMHIHFFWC